MRFFIVLMFSFLSSCLLGQSIYSGGVGAGADEASYTQADNPNTDIYSGGDGSGATETKFGSSGNEVPLPISLYRFQASFVSGKVELTWTTLSESDNNFFSVERSDNSIDFEEIAKIKAAGTSFSPVDYYFMDSKPCSPYSYYRLKQTDFDGRYTYSATVAVLIPKLVTLFPNPADKKITLYKTGVIASDIEVYDLCGKRIMVDFDIISSDSLLLDVSNLETGVYIIFVGKEKFKFVKK